MTTAATLPTANINGMSMEELTKAYAAALAENAVLKATGKATSNGLKVSEKGAVSFYGTGRWPVTLYQEQWATLGAKVFGLNREAFDQSPIGQYIARNKTLLASKSNS